MHKYAIDMMQYWLMHNGHDDGTVQCRFVLMGWNYCWFNQYPEVDQCIFKHLLIQKLIIKYTVSSSTIGIFGF